MGRWKAFIPIMLALVVAAGGSGFLYTWLKAKSVPAAVVKVEAEAIPVAALSAQSRYQRTVASVGVRRPVARTGASRGRPKIAGRSRSVFAAQTIVAISKRLERLFP